MLSSYGADTHTLLSKSSLSSLGRLGKLYYYENDNASTAEQISKLVAKIEPLDPVKDVLRTQLDYVLWVVR